MNRAELIKTLVDLPQDDLQRVVARMRWLYGQRWDTVTIADLPAVVRKHVDGELFSKSEWMSVRQEAAVLRRRRLQREKYRTAVDARVKRRTYMREYMQKRRLLERARVGTEVEGGGGDA